MSANSARNSLPISIMTFSGQGYQVSHVSSTSLSTTSAVLVLISLISNHPVPGSIIVTAHNLIGFLFFCMSLYYLYGPIKSTHRVSHGTCSACFSGRFLYFFLFLLHNWQVWHLLHTSCTVSLRFYHVKCCLIVCSVLVSPG